MRRVLKPGLILDEKSLKELVGGDEVIETQDDPSSPWRAVTTPTTIVEYYGHLSFKTANTSTSVAYFINEFGDKMRVRVRYRAPVVDRSRFPHACPRCGQPAYVGATPAALDCSAGCKVK